MTLHAGLSELLTTGAFVRGTDGIYSAAAPSFAQKQDTERELRERIASQQVDAASHRRD